MKFELSETPQVENTEVIEKEAITVSSPEVKNPNSKSVVKIMLEGEPYYNFCSGLFNDELATRNEFFKIGNKTYYKGVENNRSHPQMKLKRL